MVYLSDLNQQWPWNPTAEKDYTDKEIYTQIISQPLGTWEIPVSPPMPGYAYVGLRVAVSGKPEGHSYFPKFVRGSERFPVFEDPWELIISGNTKWTPIPYPMPHRLFKQLNESITLLIQQDGDSIGRVELLAQKFDDLLEDDHHISYVYTYGKTFRTTWIQTPEDFYPATLLETFVAPSYPKHTKMLFPIMYYHRRNEFVGDNSPWQLGLKLKSS